jgi:hypothetical protein
MVGKESSLRRSCILGGRHCCSSISLVLNSCSASALRACGGIGREALDGCWSNQKMLFLGAQVLSFVIPSSELIMNQLGKNNRYKQYSRTAVTVGDLRYERPERGLLARR